MPTTVHIARQLTTSINTKLQATLILNTSIIDQNQVRKNKGESRFTKTVPWQNLENNDSNNKTTYIYSTTDTERKLSQRYKFYKLPKHQNVYRKESDL
jgi:hypothetical protein